MTNLVHKFAQKQIDKFESAKNIPTFKAGDTIEVHVRITEGSKERIQIFTGVCIRRRSSVKSPAGATFTVKKISNGEMVERTFMLYSPKVSKIVVTKIGRVRRAKLYYLRELTGKAARIKELNKFDNKKNKSVASNTEAEKKAADESKAEVAVETKADAKTEVKSDK